MIVVSTSFLNACFTRLICPSADIHEETVLIICSLKEQGSFLHEHARPLT